MAKIQLFFLLLTSVFLISGCANQEPKGPINCGSDFNCFINTAESCTPSSVDRNIEIGIFEVKESYYIIGMIDGKCSLKLTVEQTGTIATQECKFDSGQTLASSLRKWKDGTTSSEWTSSCKTISQTQRQPISTPNQEISSKIGNLDFDQNLPVDWSIIGDEVGFEDFGHLFTQHQGLIKSRQLVLEGPTPYNVSVDIGEFKSQNDISRYFSIKWTRTGDIVDIDPEDPEEFCVGDLKPNIKNYYSYAIMCEKGNYVFHIYIVAPSPKDEGIKLAKAIVDAIGN
jgi:hypothetical protein